MDVNDDQFWRSLRDAADAAETPSDHELREAEELLREIDAEEAAAPSEQVRPEQIEQWVEQAVSSTRSAKLAAVQPEAGRPAGSARAKPWNGWLAAAAAFLVAPKFLIAATVVAGIAVTTVLLQNTTTSLPFQQAIQILMDAEQTDEARAAAGGRVYFDVAESVMTLTSLADSSSAIASEATKALEELRQELAQPTPFGQASFSHSLTDLTTTLFAVRDGTAPPDLQAMQEFAAQARYGLQAIREANTATMPAEVRTNSDLHLIQIRRLLQR